MNINDQDQEEKSSRKIDNDYDSYDDDRYYLIVMIVLFVRWSHIWRFQILLLISQIEKFA